MDNHLLHFNLKQRLELVAITTLGLFPVCFEMLNLAFYGLPAHPFWVVLGLHFVLFLIGLIFFENPFLSQIKLNPYLFYFIVDILAIVSFSDKFSIRAYLPFNDGIMIHTYLILWVLIEMVTVMHFTVFCLREFDSPDKSIKHIQK